MRILLSVLLLMGVLHAQKEISHKHQHKHVECEKPIVFDETPLEKIFELKGKVYKVLKGDDTNPSILYVLDTKTDKFVRIKQK